MRFNAAAAVMPNKTLGDYFSSTVSRKTEHMTPGRPVESGKKYLSVRCNTVHCDNMLIYVELPEKGDSAAQDRLEQQYKGTLLDCPICLQQTRVYEGLTVLIR